MLRGAMSFFASRKSAPAHITYGWRRYSAEKSGNVIILYAVMLPMLLLFVGGAVDFTRYNAVHADLVESLDAAGLAIAQLDATTGGTKTDDELQEAGLQFFNANFKHAAAVQNLNVTFGIDQATITPHATGSMATLFLGIGQNLLTGSPNGNLANLSMATDTEITRHGAGKIEVSLVLDQTGSMGDKAKSTDTVTKIESLKTAVGNLLDVLYGDDTTSNNVKVGVVPFNAFVNPGAASSWQSTWGDLNAASYYHGAHFIHVNGTGTVDTSVNAKAVNASGIAKVIDPTHKVNHYDLYNSSNDLTWAGCVESRPYPLDELDTAPGESTTSTVITQALQVPDSLSSASGTYQNLEKSAFDGMPDAQLTATDLASINNSRWVPMFAPDAPNCDNSACNWGDPDTMASNTYSLGGVSRTVTGYGYWFTDPDDISGMRESDYDNRKLIYDDKYTTTSQGSRFGHYLEVVDGFQYVASHNPSDLDSYWQSVKDRLSYFGARNPASADDVCQNKYVKVGHGHNAHWEWQTVCTTYVTQGDEYALRNAYVGWWDSTNNKYTGKYDQSPNVSVNSNGAETQGPNFNCPLKILPLTNDRSKVDTEMTAMKPYGNTNSANGAIWGVRVLSPQAPFTEGASFEDGDWTKAMVLMTDGQNTTTDQDTPWKSDLTAYGYAAEERMGVGVDTAGKMRDEYDQKLLRICRRAKDEGIVVYAIIFGLNDTNLENVFKSCATKSTAPYYYKAPSAADLENAFGDIAQDLVKLHVSK